MRTLRRLGLSASAALAAAALTVFPVAAAQAHSLDSSTIAMRMSDDSAEATVSIALETLDDALGTSYATDAELSATDIDTIVAYIGEHLEVTGGDGAVWAETYQDAAVEAVEGIRSFTVEVAFDTGTADPASFVIAYDAIIEADSAHEAVVVLTDASGEISTAGVIAASEQTLAVGEAIAPGLLDMIGYGFHHVLEGADHLLFLTALLLVAPMVIIGRRWAPGTGFGGSLRDVVGVVTAFTIGHSLTLIAAALGWMTVPAAPVEILVAASVAVAAVHAIRPLVRRGEIIIAGVFGLVHGLAFAGILTDLGFGSGLSLLTLLAFNIGVELAQLVTVALVFPALFVISRTRWGGITRVTIASIALTAAAFWILDRTGILADPLAGIEDALIAQAWVLVIALAGVATAAWLTDQRPRPATDRSPAANGLTESSPSR